MSVAKLMREYRKSGKIGRVTPVDEAHAREIAEAIMQRASEDSSKRRK